MDIKTILIGAGLVFVLWSCAGVSAQSQTTTIPTIDPATCYNQINGMVRDDWAQLSRVQRALIGMKTIQTCEGQKP
jgi:hypothetical protein